MIGTFWMWCMKSKAAKIAGGSAGATGLAALIMVLVNHIDARVTKSETAINKHIAMVRTVAKTDLRETMETHVKAERTYIDLKDEGLMKEINHLKEGQKEIKGLMREQMHYLRKMSQSK